MEVRHCWQKNNLPKDPVFKPKMSSSSSSSSAIILGLVLGVLIQTTVTDAIKCVMCDTTVDGASCLHHPPRGSHCVSDSCITLLEYREGSFHSAKMTCSPAPLVPTCMQGTDSISRSPVEFCYWTCDYDECNRPKHRSLHHILELLSRKR